MIKNILFSLIFGTMAHAYDVPNSTDNQGMSKLERIDKVEKDVINLSKQLNQKQQDEDKKNEALKSQIGDELRIKLRQEIKTELQQELRMDMQQQIDTAVKKQVADEFRRRGY